LVKIDANHAKFVRALVACHKPRPELGFGAGKTTHAILGGLDYNGQQYEYTVVDNWMDFGGTPPAETRMPLYPGTNFVTCSERDFVFSCQATYEFVSSAADHHNTQKSFDNVYQHIVAPTAC
jgi:hypothetical protein